MLKDRYGQALSTSSSAARDAYVAGIDRLLSAAPGVEAKLTEAIEADDAFAMAHLAIARNRHFHGQGRAAREALAKAYEASTNTSPREASHIAHIGALIDGSATEGYDRARRHLAEWPRDVLVAQSCLGVFGLIGFSGEPGREAENLALSSMLEPHYGDDWWFLSIHAFAQMEAGQLAPAARSVERALLLNPRDANAAHHRAHLHYETGETDAGYAFLKDWLKDYDRDGIMHCHNSWHVALGALARGDVDEMWRIADEDIDPDATSGPALNVMTDMASLLYRAELAGMEVSPERWARISAYATACFPKPRLAFADVHAALSHAMAGRADALNKISTDANGPAADLVIALADAFGAIAAQDWPAAEAHLITALADHARIGGSRAQRDLIEFAMAGVLIRQGQAAYAHRHLTMRRPRITTDAAVTGL